MAKIRNLRKQLSKLQSRAPGTVRGRFEYILTELDKRYVTNHLSARTPESLFLEEIDKEREQLEALREATKTAIIALDDWVNIYAEELCSPERVAIAKAHIHKNGLLWYVATVLEQCKNALKERNDQNPN